MRCRFVEHPRTEIIFYAHLEEMVHPDCRLPHGVGEIVDLPSVPLEVLCLHHLYSSRGASKKSENQDVGVASLPEPRQFSAEIVVSLEPNR